MGKEGNNCLSGVKVEGGGAEKGEGEGVWSEFDGEEAPRPLELACLLAATVTRRASALAFAQRRRAMTAPDMLECIGAAFESTAGSGEEAS